MDEKTQVINKMKRTIDVLYLDDLLKIKEYVSERENELTQQTEKQHA